jgi:hypothetical protein
LNGKAGMRWLAKTLPDIDEVRGGHDSIAASVEDSGPEVDSKKMERVHKFPQEGCN